MILILNNAKYIKVLVIYTEKDQEVLRDILQRRKEQSFLRIIFINKYFTRRIFTKYSVKSFISIQVKKN